jgi:hypothetical protein
VPVFVWWPLLLCATLVFIYTASIRYPCHPDPVEIDSHEKQKLPILQTRSNANGTLWCASQWNLFFFFIFDAIFFFLDYPYCRHSLRSFDRAQSSQSHLESELQWRRNNSIMENQCFISEQHHLSRLTTEPFVHFLGGGINNQRRRLLLLGLPRPNRWKEIQLNRCYIR